MGRRSTEDTTDIFRLKKEGIHWNPDHVAFEGPYLTKGATKARMSWNRGYDKLTIQKLGIVDGALAWEDIESFVKADD